MSPEKTDHKRYRWTAFPLRESPHKGVLFWVVMVVTVWAVYWNVGSILLTVFAAALLLVTLSSFYLPTHYSIDEIGVSVRRVAYNRRLSWVRIRSVFDERDGLFVSPFPVKSRMENFRGVYLPYRNNRKEILAIIKAYAPDLRGLPNENKTDENDGNLDEPENERMDR